MAARDPHRFVNELDEAAIERLIARLESRSKDQVFTDLFEKYTAKLELPEGVEVLEVGCGTGSMTRRLAGREGFSGKVYGVDQSPSFVAAATKFSEQEALSDKVEFRVGDAHELAFNDSTFDVVIANTLISHVTEPAEVIGEMARVVRPGGTVAIFDGDYASLTFAYPDHEFGHRMDGALANATFNNPRIMRDLPRVIGAFGLELSAAWGDAVVEIGSGSYFKSFAETYLPYVIGAGLLPEEQVRIWLDDQYLAMEQSTFFASCNYYTYLVSRL